MKQVLFIAITILGISISQKAFSQNEYAKYGIEEYKQGDYKQAIIDLTNSLQDYQDDASNLKTLYEYIGLCYFKLGDFNNTAGAYKHCMAIDPNDTDVYLLILKCYKNENSNNDIIDICNLGITRFSGYTYLLGRIYFARGEALQDMGQIGKSINSFDHAIVLNQKDPDYYWYRGDSYADTDNYIHAVSDLKIAISLYKDDNDDLCRIYNSKAKYERWNGQYQNSITDEQQAITLKPGCAYYYLGLGKAYFLQNMKTEATSAFNNVIKYDSYGVYTPVAMYYMGDTAAAMVKVKKSIVVDADSTNNLVVDYMNAAYLMMFNNNAPAAINYLKKDIAVGYSKYEILYSGDFIALRKNPDFIALMKN